MVLFALIKGLFVSGPNFFKKAADMGCFPVFMDRFSGIFTIIKSGNDERNDCTYPWIWL